MTAYSRCGNRELPFSPRMIGIALSALIIALMRAVGICIGLNRTSVGNSAASLTALPLTIPLSSPSEGSAPGVVSPLLALAIGAAGVAGEGCGAAGGFAGRSPSVGAARITGPRLVVLLDRSLRMGPRLRMGVF